MIKFETTFTQSRRATIICALAFLFFAPLRRIKAQYPVRIHSHNDYAQERPLWNALQHRASYIEADVFPVNGRLLVAHAENELQDSVTLRKLYIDPLADLYGKKDSAHLHRVSLVVDIKKDGRQSLSLLKEMLGKHSSLFSKDGMHVIVSGDRGPVDQWASAPPYLFFDGRPNEEYNAATLDRVALISDSYQRYLDKQSGEDSLAIKAFVDKAHRLGKPCRLWGAPDNVKTWKRLVSLGVDVVNTDHVAQARQVFPVEQEGSAIQLADPALVQYQDKYFLYGTVEENSSKGFLVYTSADLVSWKHRGYALKKGESFGSAGFWAPQVFQQGSKFYMAYVANENIAIAQSDNPAGPFRQSSLQPLKAPVKQIDPFVFRDDDGKVYLYHVRLNKGNRIFVAEMTKELTAIKPSTLRKCISATEPWENTAGADWPVAEGPSVFRRDSLYYLFYTANDFRNPDYAVGFATSNNPLGPWKKYSGNPIINKKLLDVNGTGHGDFINGKEDTAVYVFHTHQSDTAVGPRKTAVITIRWKRDKEGMMIPEADKRSFRYLFNR